MDDTQPYLFFFFFVAFFFAIRGLTSSRRGMHYGTVAPRYFFFFFFVAFFFMDGFTPFLPAQ